MARTRSATSRDGSSENGDQNDTVVNEQNRNVGSQSTDRTPDSQLVELMRSQSEQMSELRQMFEAVLTRLIPSGQEQSISGTHVSPRGTGCNVADTRHSDSGDYQNRTQEHRYAASISDRNHQDDLDSVDFQTARRGADEPSVLDEYGPVLPPRHRKSPVVKTAIVNQIEPPTFNGDRSKARSWLKKFEDVMNINGFEDDQKLMRARAYLTDEASQWFTMALQIKPDTDWYGLKASFLQHFCGLDSIRLLRRKLDEAKQRSNEHPSTYLARVIDTCKEFDPNMTEDTMLHKIAQGMNEDTYNNLVMHKGMDDWTLSWLAEKLAQLKRQPERSLREDLGGRNRKPLAERRDTSTWNCWNCGENGHSLKQCSKPLDSTRVEARKEALRTAKAEKARPKDTSDATPRVANSLGARVPTQQPTTAVLACDSITKPTLELCVNGKRYAGRVDSGADITAIPANVADELGLHLQPWDLPPLQAVGSSLVKPLGMVSVTISHGSARRAILAAVIANEQLRQPLWAVDICQAFKLRIDFGSDKSDNGNVAMVSELSIAKLDSAVHPVDKVNFGNVTEGQKKSLEGVLVEYADVFSRDEQDIGRTGTIKHRIHLTDEAPVHKAFYRVPVRNRDRMEETINRMLQMGVIRESKSAYAAPVFFVDKDQGRDKRLVADYRALNDKTVPDRTPMPHPDDVFGLLGGTCLYAKLDITAMFNQIEVDERDVAKTAIITPFGLFEYLLTPFGLMNAPATAVRLMRSVLRGLDGKTCFVYFDDIIIYASNFTELVQRSRDVLDRLRSHGLKLKPTKCSFAVDSVRFLGHVISVKGVELDPSRIEDVKKFPVPSNPTHVRSFYGLCSYNRKFIRDFAAIAKPLTPLMGKPTEFVWTPEAQKAFETLREALVSAPILVKYDPEADHELRTDASSHAIGAVLYQKHQDPRGTGVVLYFSKTLNQAQRNYSATERELLAAFVAVTELQHYLVGKRFTLVTDHEALSLIRNPKNDPHHRLARWVAQLQSFEFDVKYKKGTKHQDADCMSRFVRSDCPVVNEDADIRELCNLVGNAPESSGDQVNVHEINPILPNVRDKQRCDRVCKKYIKVFESTEVSEQEKTQIAKYFMMQDEILYHHEIDAAPTLVVPEELKKTVLEACHDAPLAGHLGFARTLATIRKRFYWHKMRREIKQYVASCHICQCRKAPNRRKQGLTMPLPVAEDVFDTVGIDLMTKLPRSHGYNTILVCTDNLSKYVVTVPLKNETSESIIHAFFNHVVAKHGCPRVVISDRGSNFIGESSRDFFRYYGIKRQLTTPYHPQSNGQTERFNRTLAASLTAHIYKHQSDWSDYLQAATFAYNTSVHSVTRVSPYIAIFGREPRLPIENVLERSEFIDPDRPPAGQLSTETVKLMKKYILENQAANKARLDKRLAECTFKVGDLVIVRRTEHKKDNAHKFSLKYIGPYRIHSKKNDLLYRIEYLAGRPGLHTVHSWDLKHYNQRVGNTSNVASAPAFVPQAPDDTGTPIEIESPIEAERSVEEDFEQPPLVDDDEISHACEVEI